MWSDLRADARLYCELRWPGGVGAFRRRLVWLRSCGLLVLSVQRLGHHYRLRRQRDGWTAETIALRVLLMIGFALLVLVAKSEVAAGTVIGPGVFFSDRGYLFLGPERIGSGTLIHERVTIGVRAGESAAPVIGDNVWIGPDCVIYGAVTLGNGATILPGSVLSMNVPPAALVGGNPARVLRASFDNRLLRSTLASRVDPQALLPG